MPRFLPAALAVVAIASAVVLGNRARTWNDELSLQAPPLAGTAPRLEDPHTPRLARRVVVVIIDGLGTDEAGLPFLDELRARGVASTASVPYPTISRPNYVTLLTGVPPRDSGVRVNRVDAPVAVDTIMDRARAAGLRVGTASDYGSVASLFLRGTPTLRVEMVERDGRLAPAPPVAWPFDDVRRVQDLPSLGPAIANLDDDLVAVLILDVDRAGHASGVGDAYRAAAAAADRMLRVAFAPLDLSRDAVIVTADHGHVAPGGHGGTEPEVSTIPLVLAGKGIVPGAHPRDARSIDVAPTAAALLGLPSPGHAEGRALVEVLDLTADDAARRAAIDARRASAIAAIVDVHDEVSLVRILLAVLIAAAVVVLGRGVLRPASLAGATAFIAMLLVTVAITRGHASPSYIPSLAKTQQLGAVGIALALVVHAAVCWRVLRRAADRPAVATGLVLVGLGLALGATTLVRAWFTPPFLDVPGPLAMVAVPALDVAAATSALASLVVLGGGLTLARRGSTIRSHASDGGGVRR